MKPHVNLIVCKSDFCEKLEIKTFEIKIFGKDD